LGHNPLGASRFPEQTSLCCSSDNAQALDDDAMT
jgi:hypothetical protein